MNLFDRTWRELRLLGKGALEAMHREPESDEQREQTRFWFEMLVLLGKVRGLDVRMRETPRQDWDSPEMVRAMRALRNQLDNCLELAEKRAKP